MTKDLKSLPFRAINLELKSQLSDLFLGLVSVQPSILLNISYICCFSPQKGTSDEICQFVTKAEYNGASQKFHFFEKGDVNGPAARPVYKFLTEKAADPDGSIDISWNFGIFLVSKDGLTVKRFQPSRTPYDEIKPELEKIV